MRALRLTTYHEEAELLQVDDVEPAPGQVVIKVGAAGACHSDLHKSLQAFLDAIPLGRAGQPADVATAALFLVSEEAAWVNGETLVVDGGGVQREAPRFLSANR
jgi:NAD(P)-dependent dehydrogenase (short-subunit alcohol dehydrogenase family)